MTRLPAARPLGELTDLHPEHMHVFVAGPGTGEGIAVALPGRGWLLLDGCSCDGPEPLPLRAVVHQWSRAGDRVEAMVLTHPHEDHAKGFADLMDTFQPGVVGLTGIAPGVGDPGLDLTAFFHTATLGRNPRSAVYAAMLAIRALRDRAPGRVRFLAAPQTLSVGDAHIEARICAPAAHELPGAWTDGDPRRIANPLSVVLTLTLGASQIVLAADLPRHPPGGGAPLPTGWAEVMQREPTLADHTGLKLPHHGSREAVDDTLMAPPSRHRAWVVTPYASSDLPRADGFDDLLRRQSPIHLTAPSQARRYQTAADNGLIRPIDRETLDQMAAGLRLDGLFDIGDQRVVRGTGGGPLDHVWCVGFDAHARVIGRWGGAGACEILAPAAADPAAAAP